MSEPARSAPRTAAALAARHRDTQAALRRVHERRHAAVTLEMAMM